MPPKERISISMFGIKAEAQGRSGIAGLVLIAILLLAALFTGLI